MRRLVRPGQALAVTEVNAEVTRPRERPSSCGAASGLRLHTEGQLAPGDSEMAAGVIKRVAAAILGAASKDASRATCVAPAASYHHSANELWQPRRLPAR
jgi:hypothetical protein